GCLGVDVEIAVEVTLLDRTVVRIPTGIHGPLSPDQSLGGLLVGRSSSGIQGLIVIPGVIDADYTGEVQIMAYTLLPLMFVPKGARIVQIVAMLSFWSRTGIAERGEKGFGSTGPAVCLTLSLKQRPLVMVQFNKGTQNVQIQMLADTGADVTIIS
ncbi:hypothetical protein N331_02510, partial [Merops nubicus]